MDSQVVVCLLSESACYGLACQTSLLPVITFMMSHSRVAYLPLVWFLKSDNYPHLLVASVIVWLALGL